MNRRHISNETFLGVISDIPHPLSEAHTGLALTLLVTALATASIFWSFIVPYKNGIASLNDDLSTRARAARQESIQDRQIPRAMAGLRHAVCPAVAVRGGASASVAALSRGILLIQSM